MSNFKVPETSNEFIALLNTYGTANDDGVYPIRLLDGVTMGIRIITCNTYETTMGVYNCVLDYNDVKSVIERHGGINNLNSIFMSIEN